MNQSQQEIYDHYGSKLVDLVEEMERDKLEPELAMTLLLDKAIDLTFHVTGSTGDGDVDESKAYWTVGAMLADKAKEYRKMRGGNENN